MTDPDHADKDHAGSRGTPPRHGEHPDHPEHPADRLDGWKAIAGYLGRDIRTVQRWESHEGLPVHRLEHKQRASAFALKCELDAWVASRTPSADAPHAAPEPGEVPEARRARSWWKRPVWLVSLAAGAAALASVILFLLLRDPGSPAADAQTDTADARAYAAFAEGQALYLSRHYREAAISLERAVSVDPGYGAAWAWLAKAYGRLAQPVWTGGRAAADRATDAAERAATLAPDHPDSHIARALAARARGDVARWRAGALRAIALDARAAEALALLGDSYSTVIYSCSIDQNGELAEQYYRQAMELMPGVTTTAANRAGNLRRLGRHAECIDLMTRMIRDYPDETPLLGVRGACRLMQGDIEGATADIAPLRNNPRIAPAGALIYLGLLALKTGRTDDGVRDLEAFASFDKTAQAELIAAEAYVMTGHNERASAHVKRAVALDGSCGPFVAQSVAFRPLRADPGLAGFLPRSGAR